MIATDNTRDSVSILEVVDGVNHRRAFVNSASGRAELREYVSEELYQEIIAAWGDTPTVDEMDIVIAEM